MALFRSKRQGFSLVELVVVIVIIGILAAIAIPRLSRGSVGAKQSAVVANLATLRHALEIYYVEHNNTWPDGATGADVIDQLTQYTDINGNTSTTRDTTFRFGPYLASMPPAPVGENVGSTDILLSGDSPPTPVTAGGEGWVYNNSTGELVPNTTTVDDTGKAFNTY
jgi:prepilin-type N-terminal cleavage/methylation domain-containing protein